MQFIPKFKYMCYLNKTPAQSNNRENTAHPCQFLTCVGVIRHGQKYNKMSEIQL